MKRLVALFIIVLIGVKMLCAQNYTEHIQQRKPNQGTVVINQSKEISELVNGAKTGSVIPVVPAPQKEKGTTPQDNKTAEKTQTTFLPNASIKQSPTNSTTVTKQDGDSKKDYTKHEQDKKKVETHQDNNDLEIPVIDTRRKVMLGSYKVDGYRVQVYAGGNSRKDRQTAEDIGTKLKISFPTEPVYVHFYSPRWICRIGNYRSYDDAVRMLKEVKAMGFKQASLVRGKITVQN
ncbi:MAG: SPOR domain-containing protein [Prevotella sp.]